MTGRLLAMPPRRVVRGLPRHLRAITATSSSSSLTRALHLGLTPVGHDATSQQRASQRAHLHPSGGVQPVSLQTPTFQVFGSNTDVGKTLISAGICRASVRHQQRVGYIKPLQTGTADEGFIGDAGVIQRHTMMDSSSSSSPASSLLNCETLFAWQTPVSPHLAASQEGHTVSDEQLLSALTTRLSTMATTTTSSSTSSSPAYDLLLVETAGGVCSPSASMRAQADVYRALRLPVVLVGDGRLGGISSTISSLESLLIRGYDVAAICVIEQDQLENSEAIAPTANELGIPVFTLPALPPQPLPLDDWFTAQETVFDQVRTRLRGFHNNRVRQLQDMADRAEQVFWWPFTQHKKYGGLSLIDSAHGDAFAMVNTKQQAVEPQFDACASWWTQGIGHGNAKMATALAYTAGRYGHVMFPENAHEPAFRLSEKLLRSVGQGWASRVYFSDDGSTAVEVALKMAFRKYIVDNGLEYDTTSEEQGPKEKNKNKTRLIALAQANCYHGDTLGVMNIAEPSVFNAKQHPWYRPEGVFLKTPSLALRDGRYVVTLDPEIVALQDQHERQQHEQKKEDDEVTSNETFTQLSDAFVFDSRDPALAKTYRAYVNHVIDTTEQRQQQQSRHISGNDGNGSASTDDGDMAVAIGALLMEPVLIGAGGMVLVDPLFQRIVVDECRARGIPVIFDEVFSGWWRLGVESARDLLGVNPDVACYAKLLTGGVVPLAVTLASEEVFDTFYAEDKGDALLHGHSFTAHPVGCAAALTALDMYTIHHGEDQDREEKEDKTDQLSVVRTRSYWDTSRVTQISQLPSIARAFTIGTVVCIELKSQNAGYASSEAQAVIQALRANHVYARALGNVVYMMCSPLTSQADCARYLAIVSELLDTTGAQSSSS